MLVVNAYMNCDDETDQYRKYPGENKGVDPEAVALQLIGSSRQVFQRLYCDCKCMV